MAYDPGTRWPTTERRAAQGSYTSAGTTEFRMPRLLHPEDQASTARMTPTTAAAAAITTEIIHIPSRKAARSDSRWDSTTFQ